MLRSVQSKILPGFKCIVTRCTALEHISISSSAVYRADMLSLLSNGVRLCKRLVTLRCPPLDLAAWEHLSNLPTLLTVAISGEVLCPLNRNNYIFAPFVNVTVLTFHVDTVAYITAVLRHSEFPSLKEFEMHARAFPWTAAEQLFRSLSQCKACQTVQRIAMGSYFLGDQEPSLVGDSFTAVTHLLCFTQLQTLRLNFHCSIFLDNNLLLDAMSCWPHIRSLNLVGLRNTPIVTFCGLFTALRLCPHLHTLGISIDAVNIDIDPTAESFQHTTLQTLDLTKSRVADAKAVARIISSMLPCVDRISRLPYGDDLPRAWNTVNRHLKSFKSSLAPCRDITGTPSENT
ncbi:hypothetical protein EV702DRAFT_1196777 [Suillus placidus]|uniref:Uncharacterized protein n=1 Tax=Suillus placidus TaxID=48579 RepID=A0A9P6ZXG9_9AGAM|nr:hypothetical protein EV702DRAFT_1196777 [Suillus placidus]